MTNEVAADGSGSEGESEIQPDPSLLEVLVCPLTKGPLHYDRAAQEMISVNAGLAFPVRDGVPILVEDDARTLTDDEIEKHSTRRRV